MRDPRTDRMARIVAGHALKIKPKEIVLIDATDECDGFILAMLEEISRIGAVAYVQHQSLQVRRKWLIHATEDQFDLWYRQQKRLLEEADCVLSLRGQDSAAELSDVPSEHMRIYTNLTIKLGIESRKPGRRKTVIRYPSRSLAQQRGMSLEAFTDFFFETCV